MSSYDRVRRQTLNIRLSELNTAKKYIRLTIESLPYWEEAKTTYADLDEIDKRLDEQINKIMEEIKCV